MAFVSAVILARLVGLARFLIAFVKRADTIAGLGAVTLLVVLTFAASLLWVFSRSRRGRQVDRD